MKMTNEEWSHCYIENILDAAYQYVFGREADKEKALTEMRRLILEADEYQVELHI
jgi:hypothetical protein